MAMPPPMTRPPAPHHAVGILFVRGIGSGGKRGDALLACGEPLALWLGRWLGRGCAAGEAPPLRIDCARLQGLEPAHAALAFQAGPPGQPPARWLLGECHWAAEVRRPGFAELLTWAGRVAPATLCYHAIDRGRQAWQRPAGWPRLAALLRVVLGFALVLLLLPGLVGLLALCLLMALMPLPLLRRGAEAIRDALSALLGDAHVLTSSAFQRAAILGRLRRDLAWMRARCRRVCIVGHAQGAAIAHALRREQAQALADVPILAVGSGEGKLAFVERVVARRGVSELAWLLLPVLLAASAATYWLIGTALAGVPPPAADGPAALAPLLSACGLALGAAVLGNGLVLAALAAAFGALGLLADDPTAARGGDVDFAAACDPVPSGPARRRVVVVRNRDSALRDNRSYFANPDELLSALVGEIAAALGAALPDAAALRPGGPNLARVSARRARRVAALRAARTLAAGVAALVICAHWLQLFRAPQADPGAIDLLLRLLGGVSQIDWRALAADYPVAVTAASSLLVLAAVGAGYAVLAWLWRVWEQDDLDAWFARRAFRPATPGSAAFLLALQLAVGLLALYELSLLTPASAAGLLGVVALAALRWVRPAAGAAPAR